MLSLQYKPFGFLSLFRCSLLWSLVLGFHVCRYLLCNVCVLCSSGFSSRGLCGYCVSCVAGFLAGCFDLFLVGGFEFFVGHVFDVCGRQIFLPGIWFIAGEGIDAEQFVHAFAGMHAVTGA